VLAADRAPALPMPNLGVIAMRRKDWEHAIRLLRRAEKLEPKVAGIRLNIGLVEYRRGIMPPQSRRWLPYYATNRTRNKRAICWTLPGFYEALCGGGDSARTAVAGKSPMSVVSLLAGHCAQESGQKELDEKILSRMTSVGRELRNFI